jgi:membrane glycosyltransferase
VLAWTLLMANGEDRRGMGGIPRSFLGMLLETIVAGLLAPVTMLTQSVDVVSILLGRDSGWQPQQRDDGKLPLSQVVRLYWRHTAFGLLFGIASWLVSPFLALWMLPVTLGLALAVPLAALTARPAGLLHRLGLLAIPEDSAPPPVLACATALRRMPGTGGEPLEAARRLAADPALLAAHRRMLPPPRRPRLDPIDPVLLVALVKAQEACDLDGALAGLSGAEKAALLADVTGLERLVALATEAGAGWRRQA